MRQQVERDGEHMWLRQSVTFSVDGRSRTLEIGIPLRAGAPPDEIEALLAEADAGMERIGRHLEARVAHLSGTAPPIVPAAAESSIPAHSAPSVASEPSEPLETRNPAVEPVPPPTRPSAASAAASTPAAPTMTTPSPARTIAERPATTEPTTVPAKPAAAAVSERAPASPPTPSPAASAGAPITLPAFIATVQAEQGLNPKQAMEKLGVKSLAGLNLREALEMLRRQALRDGSGPMPEPEPASASAYATAPVPAATPAAPAPTTPASSAPPRYFEEEDDAADIIFTEEDDELDAGGTEYGTGGRSEEDDDEYEELDEVPDFGSPPAEPESVQPVASTPPASATASASTPAAAPEGDRAARILTHMRRMRGGGAISTQQRTAFKNIVVAELGEPKAKALIAGIWRTTPEKLGPEQLDALNNWGKRETFAEDTELVLTAVKTEREREQAVTETIAEPDAGTKRPASARPTSRRTSRATPAGGA